MKNDRLLFRQSATSAQKNPNHMPFLEGRRPLFRMVGMGGRQKAEAVCWSEQTKGWAEWAGKGMEKLLGCLQTETSLSPSVAWWALTKQLWPTYLPMRWLMNMCEAAERKPSHVTAWEAELPFCNGHHPGVAVVAGMRHHSRSASRQTIDNHNQDVILPILWCI